MLWDCPTNWLLNCLAVVSDTRNPFRAEPVRRDSVLRDRTQDRLTSLPKARWNFLLNHIACSDVVEVRRRGRFSGLETVRKKAIGRQLPYLPYSTFERAIEALSRLVQPTAAEVRSALQFSDPQRSALISALRFLGLSGPARALDPSAEANAKLARLLSARKAGRDEYADELLPVLKQAYEPILQSLDLQRCSRAELEERLLRTSGVLRGQMLARTIRFLVKAFEGCGVSVAPALNERGQRVSAVQRLGSERS